MRRFFSSFKCWNSVNPQHTSVFSRRSRLIDDTFTPVSCFSLHKLAKQVFSWQLTPRLNVEQSTSSKPKLPISKNNNYYHDTVSIIWKDLHQSSGLLRHLKTTSCANHHTMRWKILHWDTGKCKREKTMLKTSIRISGLSNTRNDLRLQSESTSWSLLYKLLAHHYAQRPLPIYLKSWIRNILQKAFVFSRLLRPYTVHWPTLPALNDIYSLFRTTHVGIWGRIPI